MSRKWLCGLMLAGYALASETVPFTEQDRIVNLFTSSNPEVLEGQAYGAVFQSTWVWVVGPDRVPDWRIPDLLYATAWYDPDRNGNNPIKRISFNGRPLESIQWRPGVPSYALKQVIPGAFFEDWINWYAYLSTNLYPQYYAFDNNYGMREFRLNYPSPYRLNIPNPLRIGALDWSIEIAPVFPELGLAKHGSFKIYPSRTNWGSPPFTTLFKNPGTVRQFYPPDGNLAGMGGAWAAGQLQGLAGSGACNETAVPFEGGFRILLKACTVVVSPVTIEVVTPR